MKNQFNEASKYELRMTCRPLLQQDIKTRSWCAVGACLPMYQLGPSYQALKRLTEWVQFQLQLLLMGPLIWKFAFFLLLLVFLVAIGTLVHARITGSKWQTSAFKTYSWIQNSPGADAMNEPSVFATFTANALYVAGLTCFSFYIGVMNSAIAQWTHDIKEGNLNVVANRHTLLLNWSDQTIPILRQVTVAGHNFRNFGPRTVVIMANKEKADMDAAICSGLSQRELSKVRVITRSGDPSCIEDLEMVGAHRAQRSILLPPSYGEHAEQEMMIQSIALQGAQIKRNGKTINTVVYTPSSMEVCSHKMFPQIDWPQIELRAFPTKKRQSTTPDVLVMQESSFISRLVAQTVHHPGLPRIYSELMEEIPNTCEFYPSSINKWPWLFNLEFGEAWKYFPEAVLCGVIRDGKAVLGPSDDYALRKGDTLIMIARTQKDVSCRRRPMFKEGNSSGKKRVAVRKVSRTANSDRNPENEEQVISKKKPPVMSLLNYRPGNCDILLDLDRVCEQGTTLQVLCTADTIQDAIQKSKTIKYKNIHPIFKAGDPLKMDDLRNFRIANSDCIIVLQKPDSEEDTSASKLNVKESLSDTKSITTFAHIQGILKETSARHHGKAESLKRPRVIAEVSSPEVAKLLTEITTGPLWGKSDIFLPKHIEGGVVVQVCLDRRLTEVFENLLQPEGIELGFRNPADYGYTDSTTTTTFYEICEKARKRGEIAIGVERREGMHRANWAEDLNPNKYDELILWENDRIVVLAEEKEVYEEV